ncbi:MAG: hypothetical protein IH889_02955 [Planctomycetes bacterium]|nr:hypothetical protein [Planctomycetota bacterium]
MPQSSSLKCISGFTAIHSLIAIHAGTMLSAPQPLQRSGDLLVELQGLIRSEAAIARDNARRQTARQREIDSALGEIDRIAATASRRAFNQVYQEMNAGGIGTPCDDPAELYLSTGFSVSTAGNGRISLEIGGNDGVQSFTFLSGTAMAYIITAINEFTDEIGVVATQSLENNQRVELQSTEAGAQQLVMVTQLSGPDPIIFAQAIGGRGFFELTDFGLDGIVADLDCDGVVNVIDLLALLRAWGPCRAPPEPCPADLDNDGTVGVLDLLALLANWG